MQIYDAYGQVFYPFGLEFPFSFILKMSEPRSYCLSLSVTIRTLTPLSQASINLSTIMLSETVNTQISIEDLACEICMFIASRQSSLGLKKASDRKDSLVFWD